MYWIWVILQWKKVQCGSHVSWESVSNWRTQHNTIVPLTSYHLRKFNGLFKIKEIKKKKMVYISVQKRGGKIFIWISNSHIVYKQIIIFKKELCFLYTTFTCKTIHSYCRISNVKNSLRSTYWRNMIHIIQAHNYSQN